MIVSFHGGSPFRFGNPIPIKESGGTAASTFNYARETFPYLKEGSTEKTFTTLHTFDQKGLYRTLYGIGYGKGKHPVLNVIDVAAKWLDENNQGR